MTKARKQRDLLVVGAGPTGLSCAIEAKKLGLSVVVVEQGCVVNSIHRFPTEMMFFTTKERMEIGGLPLPIPAAKPSRAEALAYYRAVARHFELDVRQYETVTGVSGSDGAFRVAATDRFGGERTYEARKIVLAVGYFDHPNRLLVDGEDLPHVRHYFRDPHETAHADVVVVGGGNSAAEAALEMFRAGARVTMVVRAPDFHHSLKYWVRPDLENRVKAGEIDAIFDAHLGRVDAQGVQVLHGDGAETTLRADHVFVLIGFHPDVELLAACGVSVDPDTLQPKRNEESFESNVPGIFLAGSVIAGKDTSNIFIENGRFHATVIAPLLRDRLAGDA